MSRNSPASIWRLRVTADSTLQDLRAISDTSKTSPPQSGEKRCFEAALAIEECPVYFKAEHIAKAIRALIEPDENAAEPRKDAKAK